jgi:hypothetical protein
VDTESVNEGYAKLVSGNVPKGIPCWRDKGVVCGNFQTWDDFLKWDGEKFCNKHCKPGRDLKAKVVAEESFKYQKRYPKIGMAQRLSGLFGNRKRAYQVKVEGRKVA